MTDIMTEQYQLDENGEQVDWDGDGEPDKVIRGGYETMENGETVYKDVYALTQEDIDQILGVINSTHSVYDYDQEILDIITDEVARLLCRRQGCSDHCQHDPEPREPVRTGAAVKQQKKLPLPRLTAGQGGRQLLKQLL